MSEPPEALPEEELVQLFREAGDGFVPDLPRIALGAVERGRALRRRRASAVVGGAAALVLIAGGGALVRALPEFRQSDGRTVIGASPTLGLPAGMTDQEMVTALRPHLAGWRIVDAQGTGTAGAARTGAVPLAEVTVDDGSGPAGLRTAVWRDPSRAVLQTIVCTKQQPEVSCNWETLPDGSAAMTWKSSDRETGAKTWWCLLATPSGKRVSVTEWNSVQPGGSINRPEPPLSTEKLLAIAVDPVWDRAVDAAADWSSHHSAGSGDRG
ncbi:hypothetical protein [Kitasatospora sp. NPDC051914]|uniref:hypothetical protein n=1 Tax=Kitasatospora sp. NPDC051914 TaxID=3154945 RepID=UPI003433C504